MGIPAPRDEAAARRGVVFFRRQIERCGRPAAPGVVYVSSQDLYYDTFVVADPLPMKGRFQLLEDGVTELGPGDSGYLGGRWWLRQSA